MSLDGGQGASSGDEIDLDAIHQRMAAIKEEVTAEVERKWVTPYRNPEVFDSKVNARLAAHQEYRSLQEKVRQARVNAAAESHGSKGGGGE